MTLEKHAKNCCFLSTPSIYFSLKDKAAKENSKVYDLDPAFEKRAPNNFILYDFNHPEQIPESEHKFYDFVVIDPPFITEEVWEKYRVAVEIILKPDGKILASTIDENAGFMMEKLKVRPIKFRPSIPNLVYQYSFYTNYEDDETEVCNPEIPFDD